jgi:hypothetical protein
MFNLRTTALALAAIASIGAASFISSSAEARGFGGGFGRGGGGGMHIGMRVGGGGRHIGGIRRIGGGPRFVGGHRGPRFVGGPRIPRHRNWCHITHRCHPHFVRWHRPWIYGTGVVAATTYAVAPTTVAAAPRPCTCLTKEYTPDNLVVFTDVCTKEVASAPIGNTQATLPLQQQQQQAPVQQ